MDNPHSGYIVNYWQADVSEDKMARVHRLSVEQPAACRINEIKSGHGEWFKTEDECRGFCLNNGIVYKGCDHCFKEFR